MSTLMGSTLRSAVMTNMTSALVRSISIAITVASLFLVYAPVSAQTTPTSWWVSAPLGQEEPNAAALAEAAANAVSICPRQAIQCLGLASGGSETSITRDTGLARLRETACLDAVTDEGGTAEPCCVLEQLSCEEKQSSMEFPLDFFLFIIVTILF